MSEKAQAKISVLLELGNHETTIELPIGIDVSILRTEGYRHLSADWAPWREFLRKTKTEELLICMRGIVRLEQLLDAECGSTTVLPHFFMEIATRRHGEPERTQTKILKVFDWVLANSKNEYLPVGFRHGWHETYEGYFQWSDARLKRNTIILNQDYIAGLKRRTSKREGNLLRQNTCREQSKAYRALIKTLRTAQFISEVESKKKPSEFFFPDIQSRIGDNEFTTGQLSKILKIIQARSTRGRNKTAIRMMTFIRQQLDEMGG